MMTKTRFAFAAFIVFSLIGCEQNVTSLALGTLERDRVTLTATANEIIRDLPKNEGQAVKPGDVLVQLDTTRQNAILARAKAEQAKAVANLLRLTNGQRPEDIAAAQANRDRAAATLSEAQKSLRRISKLRQQNLASQAEKDKARAARDVALADHKSATEHLAKLTNGERIEDIQQAQAAVTATKAEVRLQQQTLSELTVTATRSGIIESLPYNVGERVPMNSIIAAIQTESVPYARVYVPEPYRIKLTAGTKLKVHIDGIDNAFEGQLRWIATEPAFTPYFALNEEDRARLVYLAEVDLPEEGKDLPAGVPVQVEMPNE